MLQGPDGTNGFHSGWTSRMSKFFPLEVENEEASPEQNQIDAESNAVDEKEQQPSSAEESAEERT